jgi:Predicted metal-dependent hydrolase
MATIKIASDLYNYTLQRQRRKTVQIELTAAATLVIKAPSHITWEEIRQLLLQKASWLRERTSRLQKAPLPTALQNGSMLLYKGRHVSLQAAASLRKPAVNIQENALCVNLYQEESPIQLKALLLRWYHQQAATELRQRTLFWSSQIGTTVHKITLKDQKTRWGSCSSLGNINYNWRIIMAPAETIDYLVIHELCHRIHLNHSAAFWQLVQKYSPEYPAHKRWLKENGSLLFNIL